MPALVSSANFVEYGDVARLFISAEQLAGMDVSHSSLRMRWDDGSRSPESWWSMGQRPCWHGLEWQRPMARD